MPATQKPTYVLRHRTTGRYYSGMTLGADVMTDDHGRARKFSSALAATNFAAKFGTRYEVVSA